MLSKMLLIQCTLQEIKSNRNRQSRFCKYVRLQNLQVKSNSYICLPPVIHLVFWKATGDFFRMAYQNKNLSVVVTL